MNIFLNNINYIFFVIEDVVWKVILIKKNYIFICVFEIFIIVYLIFFKIFIFIMVDSFREINIFLVLFLNINLFNFIFLDLKLSF